MEKFEQLLADSAFSRLILGNEAASDFLLIEDRPWSDEAQSDIERRGLRFVGVLGVVQGRPKSALAVPMDEATITRLAQDFVSEAMASPAATEFVEYFASLACRGGMTH